MFDFIERLQNKPARERMKIVWLTSSSITAFIFVLWLSLFHISYPAMKTAESTADLESPFAALRANVDSAVNDFKTTVNQFDKVATSSGLTE